MWLSIEGRAGYDGLRQGSHHGGMGSTDAGVGEDWHVRSIVGPELSCSVGGREGGREGGRGGGRGGEEMKEVEGGRDH